jgi:phage/plasmid-like protein (TIGR03299 family)
MGIEDGLRLAGVDGEVVYPASIYTINDDGVFNTSRGPAILLSDLEQIAGKVSVKSNVFGSIGIASPRYDIMQRREILQIAYEIVGLDQGHAHIDTIGNLGFKGEVFFAYIQVPDLVIAPNGVADTIERGLFVGTSFDGSLPNIFGYSNIRVVCANTLQMALPGLTQSIKIRHTKSAEERIQVAAHALHYLGAIEKKVVEKAEKMLKVDNGDKALVNILDHFYPIDKEGLKEQTLNKRLAERGQIRQLYDGDDNRSVELVGRNGYAAYQAFTDYIDHERPVRSRGRNQDKVRAAGAVMPGKWADMKIKASELVLQ